VKCRGPVFVRWFVLTSCIFGPGRKVRWVVMVGKANANLGLRIRLEEYASDRLHRFADIFRVRSFKCLAMGIDSRWTKPSPELVEVCPSNLTLAVSKVQAAIISQGWMTIILGLAANQRNVGSGHGESDRHNRSCGLAGKPTFDLI
jgi:hypothetical protein